MTHKTETNFFGEQICLSGIPRYLCATSAGRIPPRNLNKKEHPERDENIMARKAENRGRFEWLAFLEKQIGYCLEDAERPGFGVSPKEMLVSIDTIVKAHNAEVSSADRK